MPFGIGEGAISNYLPLALVSLGLLEVSILFPSAKQGEPSDLARTRVSHAIRHDLAVLCGFIAVAFVVFQTLNGPRHMAYNPLLQKWVFTPASIRDFPACVDSLLSIQGAFWFLLTTVAFAIFRCAMGKKSRTRALTAASVVAAFVGLYGIARFCISANGKADPGTFAHFSSNAEAGFFFIAFFAISAALYLEKLTEPTTSESKSRAPRYLALVAFVNFTSVFFTLSSLAIATAVVTFILVLVYGVAYLRDRIGTGSKVRMLAIGLVVIAIGSFLNGVAYPNNPVCKSIVRVVTPGEWLTDAEKAEHKVMRDIAMRMFKANKLGGVGTWGYLNTFCFNSMVKEDEWELLPEDDSLVGRDSGSDWSMFIAEYGVLGCCLVALPFLIVAATATRRFIAVAFPKRAKRDTDSTTGSETERQPFCDIVNPQGMCSFIAILAMFFISSFACVLHHPANLLVTAILFCMNCQSFPKLKRKAAKTSALDPIDLPTDNESAKPSLNETIVSKIKGTFCKS